MGAAGTKEIHDSAAAKAKANAGAAPMKANEGAAAAMPTPPAAEATGKKSQLEEYTEFRDDLLSFSLGEAAYDYAQRLLKDQPSNPALLALFGETAWMYEKVKNPTRREHWVDRMEVFQEGIDATRKCIREHPDYAPCYRVYTLLTAKASEQQYWFKLLQPFGTLENWKHVVRRANESERLETNADTLAAVAQLTARCASNTKRFWTPYTLYARYKGLPRSDELMKIALDYHLKVFELKPLDVENACRIGMV